MLIIFDLDDTLVDTSGCVTYYKLEGALEAMVKAGLVLEDFSQGLELLRRLNETAFSAKAALAEFIELLGADPLFFEIGMQEIYESALPDLPLFPLEGAVELLSLLKIYHRLALVTVGNPSIQMQKLKKAGIDSSVFSKILVTKEIDKKPLYQQILDELGVSNREVLVCGDRISRDLTPARQLGFKTVLMKWGRGLTATLPSRDVDYSISSLNELKGIISHWTAFSSSFLN